MKQNMKKVVCMAVIGALSVTSALGNNVTSEAAAKKIVMNKTKVSLKVGKTFKLKVKKVKPASLGKKVTYKTNKKKIATVSKTGKITAKSKGTATITVTSKKNKKVKAKVKVTVTKKENNNNVTPSNAPVIDSSAAPSTQQPGTSTNAPSASVQPTAGTQTTKPVTEKPTQKPTSAPTATPTPNIIDLDEYKIDLKEALWTNTRYEREDNEDGSVTITRGAGEQSWDVGEFGFELPRDKVGDQHKFKGIVIKYRDSTLTDPEVEKGICGYVIHSRAQCEEIEASGRDNNVGWFDFQDNPSENGHDAAVEFPGSGETTIMIGAGESDFSAVRIYDGVIGGSITIESITVIKGEDTPVESGPVESGSVENPSKVDTDVELTKANSAPAGPLFESDYSTSVNNGFENEDGSITYYTTAKYSGGGLNFYLNKDKSHFDMTQYSKMLVTLSAEQEGHQVYLGLVTDGKKAAPWDASSMIDAQIDAVITGCDNAYPAMTGNGEDDVYEIDLTQMKDLIPQDTDKGEDCGVVSLQIKYNGYQQPEDTQVCVTVKSIKFVK